MTSKPGDQTITILLISIVNSLWFFKRIKTSDIPYLSVFSPNPGKCGPE